jgi:hypothetical protein
VVIPNRQPAHDRVGEPTVLLPLHDPLHGNRSPIAKPPGRPDSWRREAIPCVLPAPLSPQSVRASETSAHTICGLAPFRASSLTAHDATTESLSCTIWYTIHGMLRYG